MRKLVMLILMLAAPLCAQEKHKVVQQFLQQQDGRPCVRWNDGGVSCLQGDPDVVAEIHNGEVRPAQRAATRGFWLAAGTMLGAMVLDVESTRYGLRRGFHEVNPLFGQHPSSAKLYGISLSMTGLFVAEAYYLKARPNKSGFRSRWWLLPVIVHDAEHGLLALHNLRAAAGHPAAH